MPRHLFHIATKLCAAYSLLTLSLVATSAVADTEQNYTPQEQVSNAIQTKTDAVVSMEEYPETKQTSGDIEFGYIVRRGNTDAATYLTNLDFLVEKIAWSNSFKFSAISEQKDKQKTAEKYRAEARTGYRYNDHDYSFIQGQYERDSFSGFLYQSLISIGYGYRLISNNQLVMDIEAGPGYARDHIDQGTVADQGILRLSSKAVYTISSSASFTENITSELGENLSTTRSESSLTTQIQTQLRLKLTYIVSYKDNPPVGIKNLDSETNVSLLYSF